MDDLTRRESVLAFTGMSLLTAGALAADPQDGRKEGAKVADTKKQERPLVSVQSALDRESVLAAGMTPEEADCWFFTAQAAAKFFALESQHPMDQSEVASAIHIIQNKLLSRPTYRKYLETAKALYKKREEENKNAKEQPKEPKKQ